MEAVMRRAVWIKLLAIAALLAAALVGAAPNAFAGQLADIKCSLNLTHHTPSPGASSYCPQQGFDLAADNYKMSVQLNDQRGALWIGSRGVLNIPNVPAGHYRRSCGITQQSGDKYVVECILYYASGAFTSVGGPQFSVPDGRYQVFGRFESY